jgi:hypothetical protein
MYSGGLYCHHWYRASCAISGGCPREDYWLIYISVPTDWPGMCSGDTPRYVFERFSVRILTGTPAILTEDFSGFHQSLQTDSGSEIQYGPGCFLPNLPNSSLIYHSNVRGYILDAAGNVK